MIKIGASFDGGGIRGLKSAVVLSLIEKDLGIPAYEVLSCMIGTSTGGLIACGLGLGIKASAIVKMYKDHAATIFKKPFIDLSFEGARYPRYKSEGLHSVVKSVFKDAKMGDMKIPTAVTYRCLDLAESGFFKSHKEKYKDMLVSDAVMATCAAPSYFPSYNIGDYYYIDGAMTGTNSPAACVATEMNRLFSGEDFRILSIGTGKSDIKYSGKSLQNAGLIKLAPMLLQTFQDGPADMQNTIAKEQEGLDFLRVQKEIPAWVNKRMDCVTKENLDALEKFGEQLYFEFRDDILKLLSR